MVPVLLSSCNRERCESLRPPIQAPPCSRHRAAFSSKMGNSTAGELRQEGQEFRRHCVFPVLLSSCNRERCESLRSPIQAPPCSRHWAALSSKMGNSTAGELRQEGQEFRRQLLFSGPP